MQNDCRTEIKNNHQPERNNNENENEKKNFFGKTYHLL